MKKRLQYLLICSFFLVSPAFAWNEPDGFKGLKWGDPPSEIEASFPKGKTLPELEQLFKVDARSSYIQRFNITIGDIRTGGLFYFLDGGFVHLSLLIKSAQFLILAAIFRERYGEPHAEREEVVKTKAGAQFTNKILSWQGENVTIRLQRYGSRIDTGEAEMGLKSWREYLLKKTGKQVKDAAKDL